MQIALLGEEWSGSLGKTLGITEAHGVRREPSSNNGRNAKFQELSVGLMLWNAAFNVPS